MMSDGPPITDGAFPAMPVEGHALSSWDATTRPAISAPQPISPAPPEPTIAALQAMGTSIEGKIGSSGTLLRRSSQAGCR